MLTYLENCVRLQRRTPSTRTYLVLFAGPPVVPKNEHWVTLTWNGHTDRPNSIQCDCGKRSCIPLRLVRDMERHGALEMERAGWTERATKVVP